ncbi:MAG TPA: sigma-70 family RNA polymerase sigma factor [Solirubrobacteraceae bacterium]|nr:sigma-70 family RNA polymerase sigma factor [Solirubrobacteraceae bacterium]
MPVATADQSVDRISNRHAGAWERRIVRGARAGESVALERLVRSQLPMVRSVARRYRDNGVPLDDLIQEGSIGVLRALTRYDERHGVQFATYAVWYVREAINRALADQARPMRVPVGAWQRAAHLRRTEAGLAASLRRQPSDREIAEAMSIDPVELKTLRRISHRGRSLDAPFDDEAGETLAERLIDEGLVDPLASLVAEEDDVLVGRLLQVVPSRCRHVIARRYGLDGRDPAAPAEVAAELGISRERIRQLEAEGLERMRRVACPGRHVALPGVPPPADEREAATGQRSWTLQRP